MARVARFATSLINRSASTLHRTAHVYVLRSVRTFSSSSVLFSGRRYTDKHEWVQLDGNIGTVGISNYAQEALGDIVYAQLPDVGTEFEKDDECGALESVKAASEIFCPLTGTITAKNTNAEEKPEIINKSCYDEGWLFKIELSKPDEFGELMDEDSYDAYTKSEE